MTPKERVHAALRKEPVDRVPIFMWFHPDTAKLLATELSIPASGLSDAFGDDVHQTWVCNNQAMEGIVHEHDGEGHTDVWGIEWVKSGPFNQITYEPLKDATPDEIRAYQYPRDHRDELFIPMQAVMETAGDYFIGCDVSPCLFEMLCRLCGMENAILCLADDPELASHILAGSGAFSREMAIEACERYPLDWLWTGDDVGGQNGMIMSPATWRKLIAPHLAPIMAVGKERGLWVAYHSCGGIRPIIPDLIEMGLDVLNPVQSNCPGMDPLELKAEYGDDLAFMGGVDTQDLLPNGTSDDVKKECERLIEGMTGDGGGYILAASHTIPPETPFDNIFALYDAAGVSEELIRDRAADIRARESA